MSEKSSTFAPDLKKYINYILFICILLLSQGMVAGTVLQSYDPNWIGDVHKYHRTEGNDFWLAFMNIAGYNPDEPQDPGEGGEGGEGEDLQSTLELKVIVTAREQMKVHVQAGRSHLSATVGANQTFVFTLPTYPSYLAQYYLSKSEYEPSEDEERQKGVHVYADEADKDKVFSCYLYSRTGSTGTTSRDASLVLPTKFLGKEYMVQTYPDELSATEFAVVATRDKTKLTINTTAYTSRYRKFMQYYSYTETVGPGKIEVELNKGEAYFVCSVSPESGNEYDLSGTTICASDPVAVFSGNQKTIIPYTEGYSDDFMDEQALPISQWGTEFYLSQLEHTRENHALVTALKNGTNLTLKSYNKSTREVETSTIPLNAGKTTQFIQIYDELYTERYIQTDPEHPVLCTSFMTSAAANTFTTINPLSGKVDTLYGDPASAMMTPWELRTDTMSIGSNVLDPLNPAKTPQYLYAYVVVKTSDITKMRMNYFGSWVSVPSELFHSFEVNPDMSYAHIPLFEGTTSSYYSTGYSLAMNGGDGFVGMVYAITSGQGYYYTLGFQPHEYPDSLYITNTKDVKMSKYSYDMDSLDGKGWYQRQEIEWKKTRLDTAYVCDTTTVFFAIDVNPGSPAQNVNWVINRLYTNDKGKRAREKVLDRQGHKNGTRDTLRYQFRLPEEKITDRQAHYDYEVSAVVRRQGLQCGTLTDTIKSIVRVHRLYNDTLRRVVCVGDTLYFFNDSLYNQEDLDLKSDEEAKPTGFVGVKQGEGDKYLEPWFYQVEVGKFDTITRKYPTPCGCDSMMTLVLFVCDTFQFHETIHLCANQDTLYHDSILFVGNQYKGDRPEKLKAENKIVKVITAEETKDTIVYKTTHCECQLLPEEEPAEPEEGEEEEEEDLTKKFLDKNGKVFAGCDSSYYLVLHLHEVETIKQRDTVCLDNTWSGSYTWTIGEEVGQTKDSVILFDLKNPDNNNEAIEWSDEDYAYKGVFRDTLHTVTCEECNAGNYGCDSIIEFTLILPKAFYDTIRPDAYCLLHYDEETHEAVHRYFHWDGHLDENGEVMVFETNGEYHDSNPTKRYQCDSIYTLYLEYTSATEYDGKKVDTTCLNAGVYDKWVDVDGNIIEQIQVDQFKLSKGKRDTTVYFGVDAGCDTVYSLQLTLMPNYEFRDTIPITQEQTYTWSINGMTYVGSKATPPTDGSKYELITADTLRVDSLWQTEAIGTHYCDSNHHLVLCIAAIYRDTVDAFTCSNADTYEWMEERPQYFGDHTEPFLRQSIPASEFPEPGKTKFFEDRYETVLRYDSIFYLKLYCAPSYHKDTTREELCQTREAETYTWLDENGDERTNITDKNGDPVDKILLNEAGEFFYYDRRLTADYSCDSIIVLHMVIHPYFDLELDHPMVVCQYEPFEWPTDDVDSIVDPTTGERIYDVPTDVPGTYHYNVMLHSQFGCDSIYDLTLRVAEKYEKTIPETVCDTEDRHIFEFTDASGNTQTIEIDYKPHDYVPESAAGTFQYATKVEKRDVTLKSVDGCDSIIHFELTILPSYHYRNYDSQCSGEQVFWHDQLIWQTGTYYDPQSTTTGCDSIFEFDFYIKPLKEIERTRHICRNEEFYHTDMVGETQFRQLVWKPGDIEDPDQTIILQGADLCDSIRYKYHLIFHDYYDKWDDAGTICSSDTFYSEALQHSFARFAYDYEIGTPVVPFDTVFRDTLYTETCSDCHDGLRGCDSIFNLKAHILPSFRSIEHETICSNETYTWHRREGRPDSTIVKPAPGTLFLRDSFQTDFGCDIIYELQLFVKSSFLSEDTIKLCSKDELDWRGHHIGKGELEIREEPYFYYDSLTNENGCDSVFHLYVIAADVTDTLINDSMCYGDTLKVLDHLYMTSGFYTDTTVNVSGCDSIIYTNLRVFQPTVPTLRTEKPICPDEDSLKLHYTYTNEKPLFYSLLFDERGHELGFEDLDSVPITEYTSPMVISMPLPYLEEGENNTNYPRPDKYAVQLILFNGICDHPETDCMTNTAIEMAYPTWITEQRFGDMIVILSKDYNGGYTWTDYQWYHNDEIMVGQTKPYLYVPTGLTPGDEYYVRLTREGETDAFATCPITVVPYVNGGGYGPTMGYLSVVPTCVVTGHPFVNILSKNEGTYRICNSSGSLISEGSFNAGVTEVKLQEINGLYIVQLWSDKTPEEPYRAIKVIVRDKCENCDTSF